MCRVTGLDRHITVTLKSRWFTGLPLRHLKASRACAPCPHKFDSSAFWRHLILTCVLWISFFFADPSHQQLPSMCDMGNWNSRKLQVSGGIIPRPPTVKSKRFHDLSFSSAGRTGIHPIIYGWEVIFPSRSIYRLLECGTQAKAIFGSQSATCLLPLASQAGVAKHVVYFDASGGATDRNIPSFSVNIMLMWLDTLGVGGWVGWVFLSVDLCLVYLGSREYWMLTLTDCRASKRRMFIFYHIHVDLGNFQQADSNSCSIVTLIVELQ